MTTFRLILAPIFFLVISCNKEPIQNNAPDIRNNALDIGIKINIGEASGRLVYWGRNADEIFVHFFGGSGVTYQVDLLTMKSSRLDLAEGYVAGRNFDNSSMVMHGRINNVYGYYLYQFNTGTYSLLLKAETPYGELAVSGNAVFYRAYQRPGVLAPCPLDPTSCADWSPAVSDFHFIDVNSKKIVPLPNKTVLSFSKTGKRTIMVRSPQYLITIPIDSAYIFDNEKAMVVDSLKINPVNDWHPTVYFDDETGVIKEFVVDNGEVTIVNAKTRAIIQKFRPSFRVINYSGVVWSQDGTKLYYNGYKDANSLISTSAIGIYDLISKKETMFEIGGGIYRIFPSLDNKKILYQRDTDWYIKNVQ
jgi:hypothetical protein